MDKRKQKSQKIIMDAFLELLQYKNIDKISINEIAIKANVNRGTIYLNFNDKYDILDKCINNTLLPLIEWCDRSKYTYNCLTKDSLLYIFNYLNNNFSFLHTLSKNTDFSAFKTFIISKLVITLENSGHNQVTIQFLSSAITGVLVWWIENSMPCTTDDLVQELIILLENYLPIDNS